MKSALLAMIALGVMCTASCRARAADFGLGLGSDAAVVRDQGDASQPADGAMAANHDTHGGAESTVLSHNHGSDATTDQAHDRGDHGAHAHLDAPAIPTDAAPRARVHSWQSLLPGSIQ